MLHSTNTANADKRIALVDCNNFYVSCERVFNPGWEQRPVGVLSNNDGCIVARSNELKAAGIKMGTPLFKCSKELEKLNSVIVSSNYALYGNMSARVMATLSDFTPEFEVYSIDEAWLDLTGFDLRELDAYGREIARRVKQHTGIPVSVGIAPTKTLAKVANHICKKSKLPGAVFNLGSAKNIDAVLAALDVASVWGIGQRWAEQLRQQGIITALDLKQADPVKIRKNYNVVMQRIVHELNGEACDAVSDKTEPKQSIIASRSFGKRISDRDTIMQAVASHTARAAEKLRKQGSACRCINVFIASSRFAAGEAYYAKSAAVHLPTATSDTRVLMDAANSAIAKIFKQGPRYAKAGIMLLDIVQQNTLQQDCFSAADSERSLELMQTVDKLNHTYGRNTVFFAAEGIEKHWEMQCNRKTPSYTTNWQELPTAWAC